MRGFLYRVFVYKNVTLVPSWQNNALGKKGRHWDKGSLYGSLCSDFLVLPASQPLTQCALFGE